MSNNWLFEYADLSQLADDLPFYATVWHIMAEVRASLPDKWYFYYPAKGGIIVLFQRQNRPVIAAKIKWQDWRPLKTAMNDWCYKQIQPTKMPWQTNGF